MLKQVQHDSFVVLLPTKLLIKIQWITFISQKSSALCSLLARTTDKASPCVVLIHLPKSIKKEVRTEVQPLFIIWAGVDSNHRTLAGTDLQSVAFSHSATYPYSIFICEFLKASHFFINLPLTRFELVASPLPRECATPAPQGLAFAWAY